MNYKINIKIPLKTIRSYHNNSKDSNDNHNNSNNIKKKITINCEDEGSGNGAISEINIDADSYKRATRKKLVNRLLVGFLLLLLLLFLFFFWFVSKITYHLLPSDLFYDHGLVPRCLLILNTDFLGPI